MAKLRRTATTKSNYRKRPMSNRKAFQNILSKYRKYSFSERDKGAKFERLIQAYLQTDPQYSNQLAHVWMWAEFPAKNDFGGKDTGIDLVAKTLQGDYWAIQCKCYQENAVIDKPTVDGFLATSSRKFANDELQTVGFSNRLWVSTTNNWGPNAEETIHNQHPPVFRINLYDLENAPVDWEKLEKGITGEQSRVEKKKVRPHQEIAINAAHEYFKEADRGKLIMACGTGKTFTSLKIAEKETDGKGTILFLVPSISLLGQTLREWSAEANEAINAICICSDAGATKIRKKKDDDTDGYSVIDLAVPASTDVKSIIRQFENRKQAGMTVVFSTYQSIEVIAEAQKELHKRHNGLGVFDLIICDEAHRTTGVTLTGEDSSAFVKVHDNSFIAGKRRIYMTATPRLFNDDSKARAEKADAVLCSMDDERLYGEEIYRIGFGEAVEKDLLSDYKVLILTVSDKDVPPAVQKMVANAQNEINSDDASKLIGCINALSKNIIGDDEVLKTIDPLPMKRAVAFCQNIATSNKIANAFNDVANTYFETLSTEARERLVSISAQHVDGSMSAPSRDEKLSWLKNESDVERECRLLSNVRCLSEGVDVPSLDAVLFLSARNSQVDVVQSVGRVMRKAEGKKYGYIIIPVVVPSDVEPEKALDDNDRYRVVWTVLNALRAHDDRFNATINKIELNKKKPSQILVGRPDNGSDDDRGSNETQSELTRQLTLQFQELQSVVFARMVEKVGDRRYWEQWAKDVAQIAERHKERITNLVETDEAHKKAFDKFLKGLHKNINPSITEKEAIEMIAQHIITKPVFEALFEGYSFVKNNPISVSIQKIIDLLEAQSIDKDAETLQRFYESVKSRAKGIDNAEGKQKIIIELYDKFFKTAFPKMVEKLGIVYTPVEVVDFIIRSVEVLLQREFNRSISDENIHILDPFTGTGTFMTRLLQNGLIKKKDLERKYNNELHANEIVLLAYYIAAINIENAYHELSNSEQYEAFEGICLTDTFQLGETDDSEKLFSEIFPQNSKRVAAQKKAPLRVIMGNPPYSVGQKSANDNAQNQSYDRLDKRIADTYVKATIATNKNALYDSYIKAFRWSTDRLDPRNGGIIAFVSNGAWIDGNSTAGFRKTIEKEFSAIYVFNLRGNQRTSGELSRKEGGKIFGSGSRTPISITFLIKKANDKKEQADIYYHDIGDYLSREEKLDIISKFGSVGSDAMNWQKLEPNEHGDWLKQRNDIFSTFTPIEPDKKLDNKSRAFFVVNSRGNETARDAWVYNFSKVALLRNVKSMIDFYNIQVDEFVSKSIDNKKIQPLDVISTDPKKISWSSSLISNLERNDKAVYSEKVEVSLYRPFSKQYVYLGDKMIHRRGQMEMFFPKHNTINAAICVPGIGNTKDFSVLIVNKIPDLGFHSANQVFPLYYYEEEKKQVKTLFDSNNTDSENDYIRRDGISDFVYQQAKKIYGSKVSKEDIFYYVYGLLHSTDYRQRFENDLKKMLPRIPLVDEPKEFWAFSKAGRALAELHLNYETAPRPEGVKVIGEDSGYYRVEKMRPASKEDKSIIYFNSKITIQDIPAEAYNYIVNGKSAIEWIMERYQITINKDSDIKNDPNDYSDNPKYILNLLLSIITISLETNKIVAGLPKLR